MYYLFRIIPFLYSTYSMATNTNPIIPIVLSIPSPNTIKKADNIKIIRPVTIQSIFNKSYCFDDFILITFVYDYI